MIKLKSWEIGVGSAREFTCCDYEQKKENMHRNSWRKSEHRRWISAADLVTEKIVRECR